MFGRTHRELKKRKNQTSFTNVFFKFYFILFWAFFKTGKESICFRLLAEQPISCPKEKISHPIQQAAFTKLFHLLSLFFFSGERRASDSEKGCNWFVTLSCSYIYH